MIAIIMAGGTGKRFWPLSRVDEPKQFLKVTSEMSMIQLTVNRLLPKIKYKDIYIVTSQSQTDLVEKHIPELPKKNIIVEPTGMNTAPAIALSTAYLTSKHNPEETVIVLPADHIIGDISKFIDSIEDAEIEAKAGNLVTFGIKPTYPATGYGYIEVGKKLKTGFEVKNFKEKPDKETAEIFLKSGNYFWNGGMFMWKISEIYSAYKKYLPKVAELMSFIENSWNDSGLNANISDIYSKMPKIPIDIGIMEQADNRAVVLVDYNWNDVGSWKSLYEIADKDNNQNYFNCSNVSLDTHRSYVNSDRFVAMIDVNDLIVVETKDALLITSRDSSERVKEVVELLEKQKLHKYL